jgi:3-hydroxyisobutyrate dehydrogenase
MAASTGQQSAKVSTQTSSVGFVGIGNMGNPMAAHLIKAGWKVMVYDIDRAKTERFVAEHGGTIAGNLQELGRSSNVVITMVLDGHIVKRVLLGDGSGAGDCVINGLAKGSVIIDMSSSAPMGTRDLGTELAKRGMAFMDAPVSGGVKGAVAGSLAILMGGERSLTECCDALLAPMGRRLYVGSLGSGHAAKALNNYVSAAGLAAASEAVIIGQRFGIAPEVLTNVLNASTGRNNSTENKFNQFILNKKYSAGFTLGLMAKDIGLAMEVAEALKVPAEFGHACLKIWQGAEASLGGRADHTEVIKFLGDLP